MDENRRKELERKIREWRDGATHFSAHLFRLIAKADSVNIRKIAMGFPDEVEAYEDWMNAPAEEE